MNSKPVVEFISWSEVIAAWDAAEARRRAMTCVYCDGSGLRKSIVAGVPDATCEACHGSGERHDLKPDMVNHPPHYTQGGIECIDAIQAACSAVEFVGFLKGQVLKYTWRLGKKGPFLEDAKKAAWYLDKLIQVTGGGKP